MKKGNLVVYTWAHGEQYNWQWHFNTTHEEWDVNQIIMSLNPSGQYKFFGFSDKVNVLKFFESLFQAKKIKVGYER